MSYPCVPPVPSIIAPLMQYCKRHHVYHKHVSFNVFIAAFSAQPFCVFSGTTLFDSGTVCYSFFFHLSTAVQHALVLYRTNHARSVHITACLTRPIDTGQQHCKSLWCSAVESTPCNVQAKYDTCIPLLTIHAHAKSCGQSMSHACNSQEHVGMSRLMQEG